MTITVLDAVSDPGAATRANEDRWGLAPGAAANATRPRQAAAAFVIDGATGLGDGRLVQDEGSDAAWLAEWVRARWETALAAPAEAVALVADTNRAFARTLSDALSRPDAGPKAIAEIPRYALPTAVFQWIRETSNGAIETAGLGDCALFIEDAAGAFHRSGDARDTRRHEQAAARLALEASGGLTDATVRHPEVLAHLRRARETHNTPGGAVWTLGATPEAAQHVLIERLFPQRPATAILATDGFADLVDLYPGQDGPGLISAVQTDGLAALIDKLRRFEREIDPSGQRFPRFKRSDDATAMLLRID